MDAQPEWHTPDLNQLKITALPVAPTIPEQQESESQHWMKQLAELYIARCARRGSRHHGLYEAREDTQESVF